jgi:hypothetical protein
MRERVGIHQFLIGRPLLLELLQRGLVGDGALRVKMVNMDVHSGVASASLEEAFYCNPVVQRLALRASSTVWAFGKHF